jgi:hypothetical protein
MQIFAASLLWRDAAFFVTRQNVGTEQADPHPFGNLGKRLTFLFAPAHLSFAVFGARLGALSPEVQKARK